MNKELRVRMLAKTERHRLSRIAWRKFCRKNPNWEGNTMQSIDTADTRRFVNKTRFKNIFNKPSSKPSFIHNIKNTLQSIFQSIFRRKSK